MSTLPVSEVAVPLTFDDDDSREIDCKEPWVDQLAESELRAEDFQQPVYPLPDKVLVFPDEIPPELESDLPQVEELLSRQEAERFLDELVPGGTWRRWGVPPFSRAFGKLVFSPFELTRWVQDRFVTK